ncbi:hypothetical protein BGZ76_006011 [Entomortierella beljakovae]|nr:hypothetical protein BGZ76_006011 [Entomortierella beljakovae]
MVNDNNQWVVTGQNFALDLGVSWPITEPVWKKLSDGRAPRHSFGYNNFLAGVSSSDNQTFYTLESLDYGKNGIGIGIYTIATDTWMYKNLTDAIDQGFSAVMDPTQNLIYIDTRNGTIARLSLENDNFLPPFQILPAMPTRVFGGGVYIPSLNSILYVGGYPVNRIWDAYLVVSSWSEAQGYTDVPTSGDIPTPRADFCMAINEDGTKIVVQGGRTQLNATTTNITPSGFSNEMYILDVRSRIWSKGEPMSSPRIESACVIVGDQFISWSGSLGDKDNNAVKQQIIGNNVIIFSITTLTWVNSYIPPPSLLEPPPTKSTTYIPTSTSSPEPGPNNGGIIGGVVAGVLVVFGAVGLLIYRRKKSSQNEIKGSSTHAFPRNPQLEARIKNSRPRNPQGTTFYANSQVDYFP